MNLERDARVLIVGPAWIGDMVMLHSLIQTLRHRGAAAVDVLAPAWSLPLLARMPEVDAAIAAPFEHGRLDLGERIRLGRQLRGRGYAQAIVIPRSFKAAVVPYIARIPRRTGYRGEWRYGLINDMRPLDASVLTRTVERYVALGLEPGASLPPRTIPPPRLTIDPANQARAIRELGIPTDRPLVGFMPGAEYGPAKRWPAQYYAQAARALSARGYHVCLFGSSRDSAVCREIERLAGEAALDLCGRTRLIDAVDLLAATELCLTNDSGLMHVAAAVGRPLVAVFGSSTPAYTPPLGERTEVLYLGLACSPCFERECPLGHLDCLRQITVDDVLGRIERLLPGGRRVAR